MEAFGFQNLLVEDGNDLQAIGEAIEKAKAELADANDADAVRAIPDEMTKTNAPIFTRLYQMAQEEAAAKGDDSQNGDGAIDPDDIIIDN